METDNDIKNKGAKMLKPTEKSIIKTPSPILLHLNEISPISDEINGGINNFRWNSAGTNKEMRDYLNAKRRHKESIARLGLLLAFPVVKLPCDYSAILDGRPHTYKKGDYVTIDFNGRLRSLKEMIEDGNYEIGSEDGKILCSDCTDMVINGRKKITDEVLEDMHDCVVALSTGYTKWNMYQFILSTAARLTDKKQSRIWNYLKDKLEALTSKDTRNSDKLTVNNVCLMILGKIPTEKQLLRKKLDFDLAFKRYSNLILDKMLDLRESMSSSNLPAPFLDKLGVYLVQSAKQGYFVYQKYAIDQNTKTWSIVANSVEEHFKSNHKLYSDEHFAEFEIVLDFWVKSIEQKCPAATQYTSGGWSAPAGDAKMEIYKLAGTVWEINEHRWVAINE